MEMEDEPEERQGLNRREFLQDAAATAAVFASGAASLAGCGKTSAIAEPNSKQRAFKRSARSHVHVVRADSYEGLGPILEKAWQKIPCQVKGKSVFLKPNLVHSREPCYTNPAVLEAIILTLKKAGAASISLGDGSFLKRDTEEIARLTGVLDVCKRQEVEFVDLNIDDLEKVKNPLGFTKVDEFLLSRSVLKADLLFSVPKMKTHHWALMTCALKNMFGVIPGRKYGWPKNLLHIRGINPSIVDIVSACQPDFAIVDGIISMEGDGPLHGTAKKFNALILGDDLTAVDTICGMLMNLPLKKIPYLRVAGQVLGNADLSQIELSGESIESLRQSVQFPPTFEPDGSRKNLSSLSKAVESSAT